MDGLVDSDVTGPWKLGLVAFICPPPKDPEPDPCDCGYVGLWETRHVYVWFHKPGHQRGDKAIRRDIAHGFPPRPRDEGWWIIGGYDERCPGCGDIERFDEQANRVATFSEQAKVVVFLDTRRTWSHAGHADRI